MAQPMLTFLALVTATGCGALNSEPCTQAEAAQIELDYQAALAKACLGQVGNCSQRPAIDAEFHARRSAWVRCKGEKP